MVLRSKGFAMSHTERPKNNLQHIQQLETAQKEFAALKMQPKESLRDFEYRVIPVLYHIPFYLFS